jgi:hypothetical protein
MQTLAEFARKMHAEYPNDPQRAREEIRFARESRAEARKDEAQAQREHTREHPDHPYKSSGLVGFCATCWDLGSTETPA